MKPVRTGEFGQQGGGGAVVAIESSAIRRGLRLTLARRMRRFLQTMLLAMAVAGSAMTMLLTASWLATAAVAAAMLASGAVVGMLGARQIATAVAQIAASPLELLLAQPGVSKEVGADTLHLQSGRALSRAEIEADVAILHRHMRHLAHISQATIAELESAREQATLQNLAKSHFLAKMSHELRTPLNAILGYATLLQEDAAEAGNDSAIADLDRIQLAGRNLLTVINDILDIARLDSGKVGTDRVVINVRELVDAVVASCPPHQRNGNRFELIVTHETGIMIGDSSKIRQCLLNLLGNAFKFTSNGKVTLEVAPSENVATPSVSFKVRDNGIGIDADRLGTLFEAFSQAESDSAGRHGGAGLGLAITRRLARLMGGDCTVRSVRGQGSEFELALPLSPPGLDQPEDAKLTPVATQRRPSRLSDKCALVVDDDEAALDLMQRWLERCGFDVFAATDGEAGLALAREHKPDMVFLDALLPRRSGYDILTELRQDAALAEIPVILVTVDDNRDRGVAAGASDYIRKPVTEEQVRAVVDIYRGGGGGEVLVIDDDDDSADLIQRTVEQVGFSTRRACDGVEGVAMASRRRPTAIVLDLVMPRLDGFGVMERLATDQALNEIPVIVVSARDLSISQHRSLAAAGHRFFAKGASTPREIAQSLLEMVA